MANVNPQGLIYLCKTPLEADYKNQLTFANATAQLTYFRSTVVKSFDNNTYIRKDGGIKVDCNIETIRQCNYMYYQNVGFGTNPRIYYCFITSMEYLSEDSTLIRFETDCFQTWYFDLVYKPCFVEREHVADDTVGANTVPEGLETGEYISNNQQNLSPLASDISWGSGYTYEGGNYMIAFQVSELLPSFYSVANVAQNYNGIYSGLFILGVDNASDALNFIRGYDSEGKSSAIVSCFITYPHFFNAGYTQAVGTHGYSVSRLYPAKTGNGNTILKLGIEMGTGMNFSTLDGYSPKNNKLKTYPYCYYLADNNAGQATVYRNELFKRTTQLSNPTFDIRGAIGQGNSIKLIPKNYKGDNTTNGNYQEGLQAGKLPVCAWASDYYLNWVTQNAINMNTSVITSTTSGAISGGLYGGLAGAVVGGATSGLMSIIGNIAKTETAKIIPDQAKGNTNVSDLNIGFYGWEAPSLFNIRAMSIKAEYARIIDEFFNMFGYKVNRVKTPQFSSRTYWNYVKTIDCNIEGDIPQEDLQIVRNMFNKGCTFWHGATNMYNYNLTNSIVS